MANKPAKNWYGIGFKPGMNFFITPVPNMERVANFCKGNCRLCPHLTDCRKYWDSKIAGRPKGETCGCYFKDISPERADKAIEKIEQLKGRI